MARKRERFERIDVPREGPYRNLIGAVVCIVVIAAVAVIVSMTWNRANLESRMGDKGLGEAISTLAQYDAAAPSSGYVETEDELHLTLLLAADSLDAQGASLTGASILSVNATQGTASLVSIPVDLSVTVNDEAMTLAELFSSQGYSSCVVPLGVACGVRFDDVVLATGDVLEEAAEVAGSGTVNLVRSASGLLSKIRTNMDAPALLSFAESLSAVGVSNITVSEAPVSAETTTNEDGEKSETGRQVVDKGQLGVALGRFIPAS